LSLKGLKVVVDAAHGAAYHIAPDVLHELGAEVVSIGCAPDGLNINKGVGATHPEALVAAVLQHGADLGIALDGDADRVQMVDGQGRLYNGDELIYLLALDRVRQGQQVPGVVGTLMTNMAVELALQQGIADTQAKLQGRGRVLIRASGTEPLLRVMVEADNPDLTHQLAHDLAALV
jgi:phosphoglucosamine mutase